MDFPAVLTFQHKLLQEYLAAIYIAELSKKDEAAEFLAEAFPTIEKIEEHREVVLFACGILGETGVHPVVNHVAYISAEHVKNHLDAGKGIPDTPLLALCQHESGITGINPYLSEYPACGDTLAEVLSNSNLVFIKSININDTLELTPTSADIILTLIFIDSSFDKLWQALEGIGANIIALQANYLTTDNVTITKLSHISTLKYLHLVTYIPSSKSMETLAKSVNAWGPDPPLRYCKLVTSSLPESFLSSVGKCARLLNLDLNMSDLKDKLHSLMTVPPPNLRKLSLNECSLSSADVHAIVQAINEGALNHLQKLDIGCNPVGETPIRSLLEALIRSRPNTTLDLGLVNTGEVAMQSNLPEEFIIEWKSKLSGTKINTTFSLADMQGGWTLGTSFFQHPTD